MADNLQILIESAVELGSAKTMEALGVSSGEITKRRAIEMYGKWFLDAVQNGRLHPCRIEDGKFGGKYFRVVDICKLKTYDAARAELKIN